MRSPFMKKASGLAPIQYDFDNNPDNCIYPYRR